MNSALLLIDIQNDYFPTGKMELEGAIEAAEKGAQLLTSFRAAKLDVIHIQHIATRPDAPFFLPNTTGVEFHRLVAPVPSEAVFVKAFPNSFRETELLEHLKRQKITKLTVAGMMTQRCIDTTVRAAFDLGFIVELVHDACATRSLSFNGVSVPAMHVQAAFMSALSVGFAKVIGTEEACLGVSS
ncbi:MAG: cysteine hydrolase family protein [Thermoleophilia bacterium]